MIITSDYDDNVVRKLKLDDNGNLRFYNYNPNSRQCFLVWQALSKLCRIKGTCGPNSICMYSDNYDSTVCDCPPGFQRNSDTDKEQCAKFNKQFTTTVVAGKAFAQRESLGIIETSAKDNRNVEKAFVEVVTWIFQKLLKNMLIKATVIPKTPNHLLEIS
ncbi:hypothetical protein L2E82_05129 [Cichorium intybus]|uniref:Uncharacterized protein n=1 Tax=Cichorium intybus TaxID=13427 RepID=A0ACB9H6K6_CICIN|nr:hypothetical protein L2E82_05129 [Cichorium intybus]